MRSTSPHCSPQKSPHCYPLMRHLAGLPDNMSWTIVHRLHECRIIHMTSTHCELTCLLGARAGQPWARIEPAPLGVLAAHSSTEPPRPHSIVSKICSVWWSSALLCPGQASPGYQAGPAQATRPVRGRPHPATGSGFTLAYSWCLWQLYVKHRSCQHLSFRASNVLRVSVSAGSKLLFCERGWHRQLFVVMKMSVFVSGTC